MRLGQAVEAIPKCTQGIQAGKGQIGLDHVGAIPQVESGTWTNCPVGSVQAGGFKPDRYNG